MIYLFYIEHRNTVKVLCGCSTGRLVSYLSPVYGGFGVTLAVLKKRNRDVWKNRAKRQKTCSYLAVDRFSKNI